METKEILDLKWKLLTEFGTGNGVDFCKEAYSFLMNGLPIVKQFGPRISDEALLKGLQDGTIVKNDALSARLNDPRYDYALKDGVYIIYDGGRSEPFNGENDKQGATNVAFKFGPVVLVLSPIDIEEATMECDSRDYVEPDNGYVTSCDKAVAQYNGETLTQALVSRGLKIADNIPEGYFIPSLGELYVMYAMKTRINKALELIGQDLLLDEWYWSSTESSASNAWSLFFGDGYFGISHKTTTLRVRPVSAFSIPLSL